MEGTLGSETNSTGVSKADFTQFFTINAQLGVLYSGNPTLCQFRIIVWYPFNAYQRMLSISVTIFARSLSFKPIKSY